MCSVICPVTWHRNQRHTMCDSYPTVPQALCKQYGLFFFFFFSRKEEKKTLHTKNAFFFCVFPFAQTLQVYLTSTAAPLGPASPSPAPRVVGRTAHTADARMSWSPSSANAAAIQYALKHGGAAPPADSAATPARTNSGSAAATIAAASGGQSRGARGGSFIGRSSANATPPAPGSPVLPAAARTASLGPTPVRSNSLTDAPAAVATTTTTTTTGAAVSTSSTRPPTNLRQASSGGGSGNASPQIVHRTSTGPTATAAAVASAAANVSTKKLSTGPTATAASTPTVPAPTTLSTSPAVGRFRPDSSAQTAALKEKLMGGGSTSNETSPRVASRKAPAPLGVAAGAVQAASQIFEQMGFAHRKLGGGSAALPAAWTSSRRTSPVMTPREDFANALPDEEDSSSDGSGPLPPPLATITKLQLKGVVPTVGPKTPTSSRSTGSNGAANEPSAAAPEGGDDSTGTESHSRFDVSELQELKRRLQLKKEQAETPRIKVHAIEMIADDGDSDGDSDSGADDAAPADGTRRTKSKEKRRGKERPKSKSSSKNALSLRRRKKGSDDAAGESPAVGVTSPPPPSLQPPPPPADDSPRKTTSSRDRPSSRDIGSSRSRKVRTLPRNARATVAQRRQRRRRAQQQRLGRRRSRWRRRRPSLTTTTSGSV
jgi:hypothetical protein